MAIVEFCNDSIDMRLADEGYGIPAAQAQNAFLMSFMPVREEVVADTPSLLVGRLYDAGGNYLTLSMEGNFPLGQVTSFSMEAAGVRISAYGSFTTDYWGNMRGTITEERMSLTQDGSVLMRISGLQLYVSSSNLPDPLTLDAVLTGADTITAGSGDDYLLGYAGADRILAQAGNDTVDGGAGNDMLDGGTGIDNLIGGAGDDAYMVDTALDTVTESPGAGADWVQSSITYTLPLNVESLTLTGSDALNGTGNELNNVIRGNSGNNALAGGTGLDQLYGEDGDDWLYGGTDNDALYGGPGHDGVVGDAGNDSLDGGAGDDLLDGGLGTDTLVGGVGHDTYFVDSTTDTITELADGGADTLQSSASFSLAVHGQVENLTLTGSAGINATGNALNNVLRGSASSNALNGLGGNDTLDSAAGIDTALFSGNRAAHTIGSAGSFVTGPDGSDTLINVERLQFSDRKIAFDLGQNQSAGNTVRVIGAGFDAPAIQQHPDWVGMGLQFFDSGQSMQQVCSLVAQAMGMSNPNLVTTLYTNVVGVAPDTATRDAFVGLLQGSGGSMTQAQLLEFAANCEPNAVNINLVGLQLTGVEFA